MLFLLPIFNSFGFNWFLFFQHLLFWLLTKSSDNNYHIDWYIISCRWFKCCCNSKTNRFSFKHVLHFNLPWTIYCSMINIKTYYTRVLNRYITSFIGCVFFFTIGYIDLIMAVGTTGTSLFWL